MSKKFIVNVVVLIALIAVVLSGCPQPTPTPTPGARDGGAWVDEIVVSQEGNYAAAVLKLQDGTSHIYGFGLVDTELFDLVKDDPDLTYQMTKGGTKDFFYNVAGPIFAGSGKLNPFAVPEIREATQWLIDRQEFVDEALGGLGLQMYTQFMPGGAEEARYQDLLDEVRAYYAYNPTKALAIITEEMENLGAQLVGGKWHYGGQPVEVIVVMRIDIPGNQVIGEFMANVLEEDANFTVTRRLWTGAETWSSTGLLSDPEAGLWHVYGGAWGMPYVFRTEVHSFAQFNTHAVMAGYAPWEALAPLMSDPEWAPMYDAIMDLRLARYAGMEERAELVEFVVWEVMRFANQIWAVALTDFMPYRAEVDMVLDSMGGISGQFPSTVHFKDGAGNPVRGGSLSIELPSLLVNPINPVAGSAMTYDIMLGRDLTGDVGLLPHPVTGLNMPQRIERAEVTVLEGTVVDVSSDWCTLNFVDEIVVPATAWADWDAENQVWITAAERELYDEDYERTAKRKSVVYYPDDLWEMKLHDGSTLSMADFMMSMIVGWDRGKEASPIYDPAAKPDVEESLETFKGVEILSTNPLTIAVYSDYVALDAEHSVTDYWPGYGTYEEFAPWHTVTIGKLAEKANEAAFSKSKSETLGVEWMDYMKGPSLPILKKHLDSALDELFIPYKPTMGEYVHWMEAEERYEKLAAWYADKEHFWVSCGAFYLDQIFPVAKIFTLKAFDDYPDPSEKWMWLLD